MNTSKKSMIGIAAISIIGLVIIVLLLKSCSNNNTSSGKTTAITGQAYVEPKQLNISIFLDLSDRIDSTKHSCNPSHIERDLTNIDHIVDIFKNEMDRLKAFDAKGKIQVFFKPTPPIDNIDNLQKDLKVDLQKMNPKQKKEVYDNISSRFQSSLQEIYSETIKNKNYPGSDIWRFFKNDVQDLCIETDSNYRNILVILTDGYIYDETTTQSVGNRVQNLTAGTIRKYRNAKDPIALIEKDDFGLLVPRSDLQNLEVLILEVSPENNNQNDEKILTHCLRKWMKEMNVSNYKVHTTDLPSNTANRIDKFFKLP